MRISDWSSDVCSSDLSIIKGLENHADDYITKPFHLDELELRVYNLILRQQTLRNYYHRQLSVPGEPPDTASIPSRFLKRMHSVIEDSLDNPQLDVGWLAEQMAVRRRTLNRKLSDMIDIPTNAVIRRSRLKRAVTKLEHDRKER